MFCPKRKWTSPKRNVQPGDIVMLKYQKALGPDKFRLAKVDSVQEDTKGLVRTVKVLTRDKRKALREKSEVCKSGLMEMEVGVQRLVVLLPSEEAWGET